MAAVLAPSQPAAPTREQLLLAYRHLARPGWPDTLDAALAQYSYRTAIHGLARNLNRHRFELNAGRRHSLPDAPVPPTPAHLPTAVERKHRAEQERRHGFTGRPDALGAFPMGGVSKGPGWMPTAAANSADRKRLAANDRDE